jgi:hypothetical protein
VVPSTDRRLVRLADWWRKHDPDLYRIAVRLPPRNDVASPTKRPSPLLLLLNVHRPHVKPSRSSQLQGSEGSHTCLCSPNLTFPLPEQFLESRSPPKGAWAPSMTNLRSLRATGERAHDRDEDARSDEA